MFGNLFKLFIRIGGKQGDADGMGIGDVSRPLDGVAIGHGVRRGTQRQAQFNLAPAGRIEMRPQRHKARQDAGVRVRLDRIMDVGMAQTSFQRMILGFHPVHVQHQCRAVKHRNGGISLQTIGDSNTKRRRSVCEM